MKKFKSHVGKRIDHGSGKPGRWHPNDERRKWNMTDSTVDARKSNLSLAWNSLRLTNRRFEVQR